MPEQGKHNADRNAGKDDAHRNGSEGDKREEGDAGGHVPPGFPPASTPPSPDWIEDFIVLLWDDIDYLVEMREYIFFHGPREQWPVEVVRALSSAI